jgi:hypothetical protein
MNASKLFKAAHEMARKIRRAGDDYRATFGLCLKALYQAAKRSLMKIITLTTHSHGGRAWVAKINGRHPKFTFDREFVRKSDVTSARSNVYRNLEFVLEAKEGEFYEFRDFGGSSRGGESGFWKVIGGELVEVSRADVIAAFPA